MENELKQCKSDIDKLFVICYNKSYYDRVDDMIKNKAKISFNVYWSILKKSQNEDKKMFEILTTATMPTATMPTATMPTKICIINVTTAIENVHKITKLSH